MNIFKLQDFTIEQINEIIDLAEEFKAGKKVDYQGKKVVTNLFFEPSTRTHYSFEKAAMNLGCKTQNLEAENSSIRKGESLYDTVRFFESIGVDAMIIRHPQKEYFLELQGKIETPMISGGDGTGNHPSQSLLDLMTIREEFGSFAGLKVVIVGDVVHSRVAHTNFEVMKKLGMEVYTSGPEIFEEPGYNFVEFDKIIDKVDVVMLLRVQYERHEKNFNISTQLYHNLYGLNMERVNQMKENAIIMHPAPFNRNVEIGDEVVECDKSRIFKQMANGVFVRMALLNMVLGDE
ncbi:MAG: aspartate carbamoyltransferase catalytic subunit [Erysipelotrichaceae bacterium]|nr:aspartate carbamoyltransferase catalytic subunit [Erysipelotrichaceae bacterium]MDD3810310.1 aspartate carbamoyltransferase catalytic subunit [Erysipelotrichaceae bacterium]